MLLPSPLVPGRFLKRYQRFFADVRLEDDSVVTAHCANSGSMKTCLVPNGRVWLSSNSDPKRKLKYTWELAEVQGAWAYVHPVRANRLVREAIEENVITELRGYDEIHAESAFGPHTRFDFLLRNGSVKHYVEVKNVTLGLADGRSSFPDAVSVRATKHLRELVNVVRSGSRASLVFCASRTDATSVEPADDIDPEYGRALRWAANEGVELLAYRVVVELDSPAPKVTLKYRIPVLLADDPPREPGTKSARAGLPNGG
ncbi:MAG: DNA/RNA nuclease SfsA [Polyangiaceae bacterium]